MILALHGAINAPDPQSFTSRNFVSEQEAIQQFKLISAQVVDVAEAVSGRGIAITVDDSTEAAANVARLLADAGMAVTLFVNPWNIESRQVYPFAVLNCALDQTSLQQVGFEGVVYPLADRAAKERFRRLVKSRLLSLRNEDDRVSFAAYTAEALCVPAPAIPSYLQPPTLDDLQSLLDLGVHIGNHGWTHASYAIMSAAEFTEQVRLAEGWLREHGLYEGDLFAVPDGKALPMRPARASDFGTVLLADDRLRPGRVGPCAHNRVSVDEVSTSNALTDQIDRARLDSIS
ncbi:hypothetical protein Ais01nite_35950 [Asanoa ishikariensis]|uniref:Polysaccharide deacetylase n=1 Tax=Asanoa ishikariensis TaxID=137265 RepID=A0A1H3LLI9_9ACTN|nr:polysaccharide deacetylase family protein [Asanoa ishikariensis]GIF65560.1 hypothetical protein Ais01nite_35950 [Asanoa ishikariensis]SDY65302.1 Polysaccharide deacetylase [Asanoa ishikariensis]